MTRELADDARSLIRNALAEERSASSAHRDRLRRRVLARAAAGAVVTLVGSSVAKASGHSLLAMVASSVGIGFGAGLLFAGAAQLAFAPGAHSSPSARVARAATVRSNETGAAVARAADRGAASELAAPLSDAAAVQVAQFGAAPASLRGRSIDGAQGAVASAPPGSALRAELDLMAQVQGALRDGQGARALELIARYDALHPSGVLETERLAAEVFAACQTGDRARASSVAQRFLARDSVSALAQRVKSACSAAANDAP